LEGGKTARRRVSESELVYPTQEESDRVKQVVDRFVEARLLVKGQLETGEPYVEAAHDFLVRGWGTLQDWINEEKAKETLELQQRLTAQANDWDRNNRPDGLLLPDGDRLNNLKEVLKSTNSWLNQQETEFIKSSIEQVKKLRARSELLQKADKVQSLLPVQPFDALVLAIQAMGQNLEELPEDILPLIQVSLNEVMNTTRVQHILYKGEKITSSVAFSPNGQIIASSADKTVRLWDLLGKPIGEPFEGHQGTVSSIAFSPNGEMLVSGSTDKTIRLWDLSGKTIGEPFEGHLDGVSSVAFLDKRLILSGSWDRTVRLWDISGKPVGKPLQGHKGAIHSIAFGSNGMIATSGGTNFDDRNAKRLGRMRGEIRLYRYGLLWALFGRCFSRSFRTATDIISVDIRHVGK
jgi:hypothetical protein